MIQKYRALRQGSVDVAAIGRTVKVRAGRLPARSSVATDAITRHAEAIGRGEPSISPVKARSLKKG